MRAVALHADAIVLVSDVWQTTCTAVRAGEEGFVIDSPVYPSELEALPKVLSEAGFPVSGLLCTHGDWDHLLGRLAFPGASLGCGEPTAARLAAEPGQAQRELREFDEEHYVAGRPPLALSNLQPLPVPGRLELGRQRELELHPAGGHTADGVAYLIGWLGIVVCGDYLSPVEIPALSPSGSLPEYRATLERLRPLLPDAGWVVPGHGAPIRTEEARRILDEDAAYLAQLAEDPEAARLPRSRATAAQRRTHVDNLALLG